MKLNGQDIESVEVLGARVHNLKNIDVEIPHYKLTVVTEWQRQVFAGI